MKSTPRVFPGEPQIRFQQTIVSPVFVSGRGYWTGCEATVRFEPAPEDTGIVFVRTDLPGSPRIAAKVEHRIEAPRRTNLMFQGASVEMVEHVLAALAGLRIDNCFVMVDSAEMPGLDGSSLAYVQAIQSAGIQPQTAPRDLLVVQEVVRVGNEHSWVEARPAGDRWRFRYRLDFGTDGQIGRETLEGNIDPEYFATQLAPARTFLLLEEAEWLRSQGLGTHVNFDELLVFGPDGPMNNTLRFEDECVRHKVLDLVGDLSLAGCDIQGSIIAHRSGHRLNAELVEQLIKENQVVQWSRQTA